jgi:hypothetical protein
LSSAKSVATSPVVGVSRPWQLVAFLPTSGCRNSALDVEPAEQLAVLRR